MAAIGASAPFKHVVVLPPLKHRPHLRGRRLATLNRRFSLSTAQQSSSTPTSTKSARTGGLEGEHVPARQSLEVNGVGAGVDVEGDGGISEKSVADFFDEAALMVKSTGGDGGGPRWFTPVDCGAPRLNGVPLFIYLPGVDGVGVGLVRYHGKLGKIFEVWCLHIPAMDRTPFSELVKLVDATVKSEHSRSPRRPIYLLGESLGACLALAVASRNPDIDLVLILVNPATSFSKSSLQLLTSLLVPLQPVLSNTSLLNLVRGDSTRVFVDAVEKALGQSQVAKDLFQGFLSLSQYSAIADILPIDTFFWKMAMLHDACTHANSRLHAIKAQNLILSSGRDPLLPSQEEGERLRKMLPQCEIRKFDDNGHFLLLEDGVDFVHTLKRASYYRRGITHDYVSDFLQPTTSELKRFQDQYWWCDPVFSPVLFSTLEDGKIVKGLDGIPSEGPTLLVGYHMLLGLELVPLVLRILAEKNILVRGIAHPMMFFKSREGKLPDLSSYDNFRSMGAVPVSGKNLFKLLASKSHVLLYPGGMREALHRKGEEYQLFWPEQSEFVRMAARFGAKIVPFGAVGEDDISQMVLDYDDLMRIPYFKAEIEELTNEAIRVRPESSGEVSNQQVHFPGILPKIPGRFYYLFGKPFDLAERREELKDREKAHELYIQVKDEVEKRLAYLKEKRELDPYRSIVSRLLYMSTHGPTSEIPTFDP